MTRQAAAVQGAANWHNRTLWTGDNLDILRGMNAEAVNLIYLDPPFNTNQTYAAPIGSEAAGAAFKDTWTLDDVDLAWHGEIAEQEPALYAIIDESPGIPLSTCWSDIMQIYGQQGWFPTTQKERTSYPTQKPLALLERIITAGSNPGDIVLDPFCGCATALVAAEHLNRHWVGIDLSPVAARLVKSRLEQEMGLFYDVHHRHDIPRRTDLGELPQLQDA